MSNINIMNTKWQDALEMVCEHLDLDDVVIVTDPPFNIGYHYKTYNDRKKADEYFSELIELFDGVAHVVIHYPEKLFEYAVRSKKTPERVVSWIYNSNTPRQHRCIAFFGVKPDFKKVGQPYKNPNDPRIKKRIAAGKKAKLYDWWNVNQVKNVSAEKCDHPCQMPLQIMENIIGILPSRITVIDPFMGTGTTALACMKYDVDFIGFEMDPYYFKIAEKRINEHQTKLK